MIAICQDCTEYEDCQLPEKYNTFEPKNCAYFRKIKKKASETEIRITNPNTGGQKGSKLARFDLIPAKPLWALAELYGRGLKKYPARNWEKGYAWSMSFAAMLRHAWLFWMGEEFDSCKPDCPPDCTTHTGAHHLDSVAWHAFTLREYRETHPELDDRPKKG